MLIVCVCPFRPYWWFNCTSGYFFMNLPTLWYLKNMLSDMQPRPIWEKIVKTFDGDPPASRISIHNRKFPAGNFVPGITGWLYHVYLGFGHLGLEQLVITTASVPTWWTSTIGLWALQLWQKPNNNSNCDRKTICLGFVRRFVPLMETL